MLLALVVFAACRDDIPEESGSTDAGLSTEDTAVTATPLTPEASAGDAEDGFVRYDDYVKVTAVSVNVRKEPSAEATIYKLLAKDEVVRRTGDNGEWTRVIVDNSVFYISSRYVEKTEPADLNPPASPSDSQSSGGGNTQTSGIQKNNDNIKRIVIDPGNQATDNYETEQLAPDSEEMKQCVTSGIVGAALETKEYALNLIYAKQLKTVLEARGYEVVLTRSSDDVDMSNKERALFASEISADLMIRLQMNSSESQTLTGVMAVTMLPDNPYNSEYYALSNELATRLLQSVVEKSGAVNRGIYETDGLTLINWSKTPVVVLKLGFLSNEGEEIRLNDTEYQSKLIEGIADGLDYYFAE